MPSLTPREQALVSLGVAMGSNCIACIEHHIPASREAGLSDAQISEAIELADLLKQLPARKTLEAAQRLLSETAALASSSALCGKNAAHAGKSCCG